MGGRAARMGRDADRGDASGGALLPARRCRSRVVTSRCGGVKRPGACLGWTAASSFAAARSSGLRAASKAILKQRARDILSKETAEAAERAGVTLKSVSVGDADTRWGSCSASGRIRYSWRLILAPPDARRYVVAHEVAHLVHMDHGRAFKALERKLFDGDVDAARLLLRRVGGRLKRIGRTR